MFKYIGIRGHRGAGKNTIGFLLGTAIEYYVLHNTWDGFDEVYKKAVDEVIENGNTGEVPANDYTRVYFESFADTPKVTLAQILGIPVEWMYDDWIKDSTLFDLHDFSYTKAKSKIDLAMLQSEAHPWGAEQLYQFIQEGKFSFEETGHYMFLRDLIVYYSRYVMQNYFGKNVWVKSLENNKYENERFFASNKTIYKIFVDCKFPSEISYIYKNEGKVVKVVRDNNVKTGKAISEEITDDPRYDFLVELDGNLLNEDTIETIKSITLKIISE